jgi:hypothetical protein
VNRMRRVAVLMPYDENDSGAKAFLSAKAGDAQALR